MVRFCICKTIAVETKEKEAERKRRVQKETPISFVRQNYFCSFFSISFRTPLRSLLIFSRSLSPR